MRVNSIRIQRYSAPERINHWIVAFCFVFAAISGLGFLFPSLNWLLHILGTPQLTRILHPFVGVVMFVAFLLMFLRYWKHNLIQRDDMNGPKISIKLPEIRKSVTQVAIISGKSACSGWPSFAWCCCWRVGL